MQTTGSGEHCQQSASVMYVNVELKLEEDAAMHSLQRSHYSAIIARPVMIVRLHFKSSALIMISTIRLIVHGL